jgi:GT2 family glycosyltransferase
VNHEPSVSFVVVNWNQCELTLDCLASLSRQHYENFNVILVDNGSMDGSVAAIREGFPTVTVIENGQNLGFTGGNNAGIRAALAQRPDYVFLLNNDTAVDPDMLSKLVDVAESDIRIGITAPTMLYFAKRDMIWCGGNRIDWRNGATYRLRDGTHESALQDTPCEDADFLTACAVCVRRAVFETIGLLEDRYFIYYDDTDLCARASKAGWRLMYVPRAKMWHKVSAAMGIDSPTTDYYMVRNSFLFLIRNLSGSKRVAALMRAGFGHGRAIVAYTVKSQGGARLRNRDAKLLGVRDAVLGRWGQMGPDVARVCRKS